MASSLSLKNQYILSLSQNQVKKHIFVQIATSAQVKTCANVKNKIFSKFLSPNPINTYKFRLKKIREKFVKSAQVFSIYGGTYIGKFQVSRSKLIKQTPGTGNILHLRCRMSYFCSPNLIKYQLCSNPHLNSE